MRGKDELGGTQRQQKVTTRNPPDAGLSGCEKRHEVVELSGRELILVGLRHHARAIALGNLGIGIDDRLADEGRVLASQNFVEVGPGGAGGTGGGEGMATAAALGSEDGLAGLRRT